jgi:hypothetical protein
MRKKLLTTADIPIGKMLQSAKHRQKKPIVTVSAQPEIEAMLKRKPMASVTIKNLGMPSKRMPHGSRKIIFWRCKRCKREGEYSFTAGKPMSLIAFNEVVRKAHVKASKSLCAYNITKDIMLEV